MSDSAGCARFDEADVHAEFSVLNTGHAETPVMDGSGCPHPSSNPAAVSQERHSALGEQGPQSTCRNARWSLSPPDGRHMGANKAHDATFLTAPESRSRPSFRRRSTRTKKERAKADKENPLHPIPARPSATIPHLPKHAAIALCLFWGETITSSRTFSCHSARALHTSITRPQQWPSRSLPFAALPFSP